jgi:hypothetical protein
MECLDAVNGEIEALIKAVAGFVKTAFRFR